MRFLPLFALLLASPAALAQSFTARIDALRLTGDKDPLRGAYIENTQAAGLRWYLVTRGVQSIALDARHDKEVVAYLDRYLAAATVPGASIDDIENRTGMVKKVADSDDAYAGTILSLASWYAGRGQGGKEWFDNNLKTLEHLATANIVDNIDKKSNLPNTYHSFNERDKLLPQDKQVWLKVGQTMDACEAYRGLKDFAERLDTIKNKEAKKYHAAADKIAGGVKGMFDAKAKGFRVNTSLDAPGIKFYPDRVIQVAPEVFGVPLGKDTQAMYDDAWKYAQAGGDKWWAGKFTDDTNDGMPFMILAQAAAVRGDRKMAEDHLKHFRATLGVKRTKPEYGSIHELGWALLAERTLAQMK